MSNPRSGSTWLETCLGELPDVAVDYEMKWGPAVTATAPSYLLIPGGEASCRNLLSSISPDAPIVGSKLVLDGRQFRHEEVPQLLRTVEPDIRVIHLTRRYFDILQSWQGHGAVHAFDPNWKPGHETRLFRALKDDERSNPLSQSVKMSARVHTRRLPYYIHEAARRAGLVRSTSRYVPPETLIDALLAFFLNDLICIQACRRAERSLHVDYRDIAKQFLTLAEFVGSHAARAAADAIIANPPTQKLAEPRRDLFANRRAIEELSELLYAATLAAIGRRTAIEDYWDWDTSRGVSTIKLESLTELVRAVGGSRRIESSSNQSQLRWIS